MLLNMFLKVPHFVLEVISVLMVLLLEPIVVHSGVYHTWGESLGRKKQNVNENNLGEPDNDGLYLNQNWML